MSEQKKEKKPDKRRPDIVEITPPGSMPEFSGQNSVGSGAADLMPAPCRRAEIRSEARNPGVSGDLE